MKPLLTTFIACTLASFVLGQKFDVSISPEVKYQRGTPIVRAGNNFLAMELVDYREPFFSFKINKMKFGIKLVMYDSSMKMIRENVLANGDKPFGPLEPLLREIDGKLCLLYYRYVELADEGQLKLVLAEIDLGTLALLRERECLTIGQGNTGLFRSFKRLDKKWFRTAESPDGNKKLFFWAPQGSDRYSYAVASKDLVFGTTVAGVVTGSKEPGYQSVCIDNGGVVYVGYKGDAVRDQFHGRVLVGAADGRTNDMEVALPEG